MSIVTCHIHTDLTVQQIEKRRIYLDSERYAYLNKIQIKKTLKIKQSPCLILSSKYIRQAYEVLLNMLIINNKSLLLSIYKFPRQSNPIMQSLSNIVFRSRGKFQRNNWKWSILIKSYKNYDCNISREKTEFCFTFNSNMFHNSIKTV